jgi:hypothetical protein
MTTYDELLSRLKTLEGLLSQPALRDSLPAAHAEALSIARDAPGPGIADLASKVIAAINELQRKPDDVRTEDIPLQKALWRLRLALQEAKRREDDRR